MVDVDAAQPRAPSARVGARARRGTCALAAAMLVGACGPMPVDVVGRGTARQSIIGGSAETAGALPAIVGIVGVIGNCTATLIAPDAVLTAAHCAQDPLPDVVVDRLDLADDGGGRVIALTALVVHPDYDEASGLHDLAVGVLATPLDDRAPLPLDRDGGDRVGDVVTHVGFGEDGAGGDGVLRAVDEAVVACGAQDDQRMCFDGADGTNTCNGDSGGPALRSAGEAVVVTGAVSRGDPDCEVLGVDTRVSANLDFLDGFVDVAEGEGEGEGEGDGAPPRPIALRVVGVTPLACGQGAAPATALCLLLGLTAAARARRRARPVRR